MNISVGIDEDAAFGKYNQKVESKRKKTWKVDNDRVLNNIKKMTTIDSEIINK